ncbi:SLBB domain-containing protein [Arundinibacter roseus]|uniref:Polysaccharide export protein n=1 Tax=Arundinibacter roseus TaxID=2070510 RepID=A0A4R4KLM6_9BACT|nr:SLBB domain-containing protein [Arundinibacter roseus]TDB67832.1 polysaccharide export protein [Arundinibacter roseus]
MFYTIRLNFLVIDKAVTSIPSPWRYIPIMTTNRFLLPRFLCLLALSLLLLNLPTHAQSRIGSPAQVSPAQLLSYYKQAKASGMTDMQIEQAAMAQGYTLSDIAKLRTALMEAQKNPNATSGMKRDTTSNTREQVGTSLNDDPQASEPPVELSDIEKRIFGANFFRNTSLTFEPNLRMATPKNYVLGPDDQLIVDIYGNAVENFQLNVSPEGTVKMLNLAPVYVNGLTIEQASERIVTRLRQAFSSLNRPGSGTYATISLGDVRSIRVVVTGEVKRPGSYTVSSLATAFNALYLSGGPSENGSFRKIEVIRGNNVVAKIDLYSFIVNAELKDNITLQDQDIIMVHPYQARVELIGEVKHEGLFEARPGDTFQDLMRYAGGFGSNAYTASVRYRRNTGKELRIGMIGSDAAESFQLKDGDLYQVDPLLDRYENLVTIEGPVFRPGLYAIEAGSSTVKELILKAEGLREDAFLNRAIIQRKNEYLSPQTVSFDLGQLMRGEIEDIPLKREDILVIKSVQQLQATQNISIQGSVNKPGTYAYSEGMTVSDLIYLSGGYAEGGTPDRIEVARRVRDDSTDLAPSQTTRIFSFDIEENLQLQPKDRRFRLQPFDLVFVRKSPRYDTQKTIVISGEVNYPGRYAILNNTERISDIIERAGGLKANAYLAGARLTRQLTKDEQKNTRTLEEMTRKQLELQQQPTENDRKDEDIEATPTEPPVTRQLVGLDMVSLLRDISSPANILLQEGDSIIIPRKIETVRILGEVLNPSIVNYDPKFSFNDYISQAGGYTDNARKHKAFVAYANGRLDRTKRALFFISRPKITPGTTINVPIKIDKSGRETTPAERVAILSLLGTLALTIIRLF